MINVSKTRSVIIGIDDYYPVFYCREPNGAVEEELALATDLPEHEAEWVARVTDEFRRVQSYLESRAETDYLVD